MIYRYKMGTKEVIPYFTSRLGTLVLWVIMVSCFIFLAIKKPHGTALWAGVTTVVLIAGMLVAKRRAPEIKEIGQGDSDLEMILYLSGSARTDLHIIFRRPREEALEQIKDNEAYVTFYSPRQGIPPKLAPNHFRLPWTRMGLYQHIVALLRVVEYEMAERDITVHFGWPMSSWLDRMAIGVMVFNLVRLPRFFPRFKFNMSYQAPWPATGQKASV
jgi:hypothetical protein